MLTLYLTGVGVLLDKQKNHLSALEFIALTNLTSTLTLAYLRSECEVSLPSCKVCEGKVARYCIVYSSDIIRIHILQEDIELFY